MDNEMPLVCGPTLYLQPVVERSRLRRAGVSSYFLDDLSMYAHHVPPLSCTCSIRTYPM